MEYILIVPATQTCVDGRHTFLTTRLPPDDCQVCECGRQSWTQAREEARLRFALEFLPLDSAAKKA